MRLLGVLNQLIVCMRWEWHEQILAWLGCQIPPKIEETYVEKVIIHGDNSIENVMTCRSQSAIDPECCWIALHLLIGFKFNCWFSFTVIVWFWFATEPDPVYSAVYSILPVPAKRTALYHRFHTQNCTITVKSVVVKSKGHIFLPLEDKQKCR